MNITSIIIMIMLNFQFSKEPANTEISYGDVGKPTVSVQSSPCEQTLIQHGQVGNRTWFILWGSWFNP